MIIGIYWIIMIFSIITLFPEIFAPILNHSILKHAQAKKLTEIRIVNPRDFATDKYKTVDDHPFGGGVGMILKVDILTAAIKAAKQAKPGLRTWTILLDPKGQTYTQALARSLITYDHLILVSGHYEGVDFRITKFVDQTISIGNYILTGGEIPALVMVDSITRLLPGVLKPEATNQESFTKDSLEAPQYTRPRSFRNLDVPQILLSGDHKKIQAWQKTQSSRLTRRKPQV
ncbi:MAG: tRNA (guanine-N(1)-)-methyltransferase [Candidatus Gottesmanbacteria bacterium GW2011_GWA2_42_16]|nr:MAG: tRNA (guanine-N(1)-)-methyltransferase [Candidatus Gottesmanbacteria bacterium GW2011_GWA2_42_16]